MRLTLSILGIFSVSASSCSSSSAMCVGICCTRQIGHICFVYVPKSGTHHTFVLCVSQPYFCISQNIGKDTFDRDDVRQASILHFNFCIILIISLIVTSPSIIICFLLLVRPKEYDYHARKCVIRCILRSYLDRVIKSTLRGSTRALHVHSIANTTIPHS